MEFDSIKHLGVNPNLFDLNKCHEDYDQGTINHITILHLKKEKLSAFSINCIQKM